MKLLRSLIPLTVSCADQWMPAYKEGHGGMVHLFEWHWDTIAAECENFLGPHKFAAVQVSPPNENRPVTLPTGGRPWWERYQPVSYKLETRSGTRAQFADMVKRCNAVGVRIIVDAIINHMLGEDALTGTGTAGSSYNSDTLDFPAVPYSASNFNDYRCDSSNGLITNYGDVNQVRNCRLVGLVDLDQSNMDTAKKTADYMNDLIDMGVVGFRVDASKHMWPAEDAGLYALLHDLPVSEGFAPGSKAWLGQEVIDQGGEPIKKEQYTGMGCVTEFNYCFSLANLQNSLAQLKTLADTPSSWGFLSDKDAFVFVNNHDNQRGHGGGGGIITFEDPHALKVATGIMMALPYGKKRIMSSYFFSNSDEGPPAAQPSTSDSESGECTNGWVCEHRWPGIKNLGMLEGAMNLSPGYENWWDNGASQVSFNRGEGFFVINNDPWELNGGIQTGLPAGKYCDLASNNIAGCASTIDVDADGIACINIQSGASIPMAYTILEAKMGEYTLMNECPDLAAGPISECYDCNCASNKKLDCGVSGTTEATCGAKGCAWCPSTSPGDPWCFWLADDAELPTGTPPTTNPGNPDGGALTCPPEAGRDDCGFMGIDQSGCEAKGCAWCPTAIKGTPWCTTGIPAGTTVGTTAGTPGTTQSSGSTVSTAPGTGVTKPPGSGTDECTIFQLCPSVGNCNIVDLIDRKDCGELASTPTTCVASGCCWEEQPPGAIPGDPLEQWPPWCYYTEVGGGTPGSSTAGTPVTTKTTAGTATTATTVSTATTASTPSTASTAPGTGTPGTGSTISMPTIKPPGEETDECTSTQLCPLVGNCNIPSLIDRVDCGELASTPTTCVAAGCCWEEQAPGPIPDDPEGKWPPWCYNVAL